MRKWARRAGREAAPTRSGGHFRIKRLFGDPEHAAALVRHSLPSRIVDRLDLSTMVREPASFVDDQLSERYSDLLFSVTSTRGRVFVYLLIEHQSSNDPDMPLRLLEYMVRIWVDQRRRDPTGPLWPIIPLLICHPPGGWTAARRLDELFDHDPDFAAFIPDFELPIQDLEFLGDDDFATACPAGNSSSRRLRRRRPVSNCWQCCSVIS